MLRLFQKIFLRAKEDAGGRGEQLAAEWLRRERGFKIVAQNWRSPRDRRDEIDLIARDGEVLVFVEVKARSANALVPGYHAVDERKKRAVRRAAETYLARLREQRPNTFRFDVVEIALPANPNEAPQILHFENVPLFGKHFQG